MFLIDMDAQGYVEMSFVVEIRGRSWEVISNVLFECWCDVYEIV